MRTFKFLLAFIYICSLFISCKQKTITKEVPIDLPYIFKIEKAEDLSVRAFALSKENKYDEAINLYQQAIVIEQDNPKLFFDISECYAKKEDLNNALFALDTAIKLDSLNPHFYNNRGLVYWKVHRDDDAITDYLHAITLGFNHWVTYANLSVVYYWNKKQTKACETFKIAKQLGLPADIISGDKHLTVLQEACK
ncbi:MAG: tetratricopeptide repeat protein [Ferruginibacter sp.]